MFGVNKAKDAFSPWQRCVFPLRVSNSKGIIDTEMYEPPLCETLYRLKNSFLSTIPLEQRRSTIFHGVLIHRGAGRQEGMDIKMKMKLTSAFTILILILILTACAGNPLQKISFASNSENVLDKGDASQANPQDELQNSPWIGVWECSNGDVFICRYSKLADYKYDMYYYDTKLNYGWQVNVSPEEVDGNYIESYMIDPEFNYDAVYYMTVDANTLTYSGYFHEEPTPYVNMVFEKTDRTDIDAAWSEYWDK